jgi:AraC-like DNA-binding protein
MKNTVFYEIKHGMGADYFAVERKQDFSYPLHMHRCYEAVMLLEGSMTVRIEKEEYLLNEGDLILIKPNRVHSFETRDSSRHILCIFAPELIAAITDSLTKYRLTSPVLREEDPLVRQLFLSLREDADIATVKGFLYLLCSHFYRSLDRTAEDTYAKDTTLLRDIFYFVETNTDKPCTLESLAESLKYTASYLSRFFSANVGMSYNTYVRNVKMNRASYLLRNTRDSILSIALKCGYTSLSSFNRSFKQLTGMSPTHYRDNLRAALEREAESE